MKSQDYLSTFDRLNRFDVGGKPRCVRGHLCGERCLPKRFKCRDRNVIQRNASQPSESSPRKARLASLGVPTAAVMGVVGSVLVEKDIKKVQVDFNSIRMPPNGIPDEETLKTYDSFTPGDVIRRNFKFGNGANQHYAIYAGKNPKTGDHECIQLGRVKNAEGKYDVVIHRASLNSVATIRSGTTQYEKVPPSQVYTSGQKPFTPKQILERAESAIGQKVYNRGFFDNCETFARGIATGNPLSTQSGVSFVTKALGQAVVSVGVHASFPGYWNKQGRVSPATLIHKVNSGELRRKDAALLEFDGVLKSYPKQPDSWLKQQGLRDHESYVQAMKLICDQYPGSSERLTYEMVRDYLFALGKLAREYRNETAAGKSASENPR